MNPAKFYEHIFSPLGEGADAFGASGLISFLRAPHIRMTDDALKDTGARYAFIGVPYEEGNIGKPGSSDAPREMRFMSHEYFSYWFEYEVDTYADWLDCGDVRIPKVVPDMARARIYEAVRAVLAAGLIPVLCGGDQSIAIPAAKALSDHLGASKKLGFLQFGAHLSMADEWGGERNTNASVMARVSELPNVTPKSLAHIGARNFMNPKDWWDLGAARGIGIHPMSALLQRGVGPAVGDAIETVCANSDAQYVSVNANILDASAAPGVTFPEPGGLESREMMVVADLLGARDSIAMIDATELCPVMDVNGNTAKLMACFLLRIAAVAARKRGSRVDPSIKREQLRAG